MTTERTRTVEGSKIGPRFLSAIAARDFVSMASCFSENARFRALVPSGLRQAVGGNESASYFQKWFGPADRIELLDGKADTICDRQHMSWRLRVHDHMGRRVIEQQAFVTVKDGQFVEFDLLCSGFRAEDPLPKSAAPELNSEDLAVAATLTGGDANCATLTPLIKSRLSELASGEVLEVVTSEPTAERDIVSWCNLTGHTLVGVRSEGSTKRFYVRKKS